MSKTIEQLTAELEATKNEIKALKASAVKETKIKIHTTLKGRQCILVGRSSYLSTSEVEFLGNPLNHALLADLVSKVNSFNASLTK